MPAAKTANKTMKTERKPAGKAVPRTLAGKVLPQDGEREAVTTLPRIPRWKPC